MLTKLLRWGVKTCDLKTLVVFQQLCLGVRKEWDKLEPVSRWWGSDRVLSGLDIDRWRWWALKIYNQDCRGLAHTPGTLKIPRLRRAKPSNKKTEKVFKHQYYLAATGCLTGVNRFQVPVVRAGLLPKHSNRPLSALREDREMRSSWGAVGSGVVIRSSAPAWTFSNPTYVLERTSW